MLSPKFVMWASVALAGFSHAHIGPYHPAMYAINGTDAANPSLYTGISSNPLYNLKYDEYWMHAIHGVLNFPPPQEDAIEIVPGGTITLELAENARFTTLSPNPILSPWGDGGQHPNGYSITNLGGATISPSGCLSSPNLHTQNESMAAGTALAILYESDPTKVTPENTIVISVLEHTPFHRVATYQIPEGLPPSNDLVHLIWGWAPRHCGQANEYFYPLLAKVVPGSAPAKTLGKPAPPAYCGYGGSDPSRCVKGPKQMVIVQQAERNNVIGADVLDFDGLWAAPGYNPSCGWASGAQSDIFVDAGSPNALFSVAGASLATSNQTVTSSASATSTSTDLTSGTPTASDPVSSLPPASGTPATTPADSGTLTFPSSAGAQTTPQKTCTAGHGGHKRRIVRRENHSVF